MGIRNSIIVQVVILVFVVILLPFGIFNASRKETKINRQKLVDSRADVYVDLIGVEPMDNGDSEVVAFKHRVTNNTSGTIQKVSVITTFTDGSGNLIGKARTEIGNRESTIKPGETIEWISYAEQNRTGNYESTLIGKLYKKGLTGRKAIVSIESIYYTDGIEIVIQNSN